MWCSVSIGIQRPQIFTSPFQHHNLSQRITSLLAPYGSQIRKIRAVELRFLSSNLSRLYRPRCKPFPCRHPQCKHRLSNRPLHLSFLRAALCTEEGVAVLDDPHLPWDHPSQIRSRATRVCNSGVQAATSAKSELVIKHLPPPAVSRSNCLMRVSTSWETLLPLLQHHKGVKLSRFPPSRMVEIQALLGSPVDKTLTRKRILTWPITCLRRIRPDHLCRGVLTLPLVTEYPNAMEFRHLMSQ